MMNDPDALDPVDRKILNILSETDGVPETLPADEKTAPMRLPNDTIPCPFVGDEDWEGEDADDEPTLVRRPIDPTGCMM